MKHLVTVWLALSLMSLFVQASEGWARTYGGTDADIARCVQPTLDGGYVIAGISYSFGSGSGDILVLKIDSGGNIQWQKIFGEENKSEYAYSIQETRDGGYIVAGNIESYNAEWSTLVWILKLDRLGNIQWQETIGSSGENKALSIVQTSDDGYLIGGLTSEFCAGKVDYWVIKLGSSGDIIWQKTYGGSASEQIYSIQETLNGGFIAAGTTYSFGAGACDAWIIKCDSSGNVIWQKSYGNISEDRIFAVQQTLDGGYITAGATYSLDTEDWGFLVMRLDALGGVIWQETVGGTYGEYCFSLDQTSDGGYILAGETAELSQGYINVDVLVLKLDSSGGIVWKKIYQGCCLDEPFYVRQTPDGGYVVVGRTTSFGDGDLDIFVLKLDSNGNISDSACSLIMDSSVTSQDWVATIMETTIAASNSSAIITSPAVTSGDSSVKAMILCSDVIPPTVSSMTKLSSPFRLKLTGSNFSSDLQAFIGGDYSPWPTVVYKSGNLLLLKGGNSLKNRFPKGVPVEIKVVNGDGGTATIAYTR